MKVDYTIKHMRKNLWVFVLHDIESGVDEKLEGKVITVLEHNIRFKGTNEPRITADGRFIFISLTSKEETGYCIFSATKNQVHIIHNALEWVNEVWESPSPTKSNESDEPGYQELKQATERLHEIKEHLQDDLITFEIPKKMINVKHLFDFKLSFCQMLLGALPIYADTCPYCSFHKNDETLKACTDCKFGKKHGICELHTSDWNRMHSHLTQAAALLEKLYGCD